MMARCQLLAVSVKRSRRTFISRTNTKLVTMLICLLIVSANAVAQFKSGTVIIVGFSNKKILMAADSRATQKGEAPLDDQCKITAVSDQFLFTAAGRTMNIVEGIVGWDVQNSARQAFAVASKRPRLPSHTLVRDIAEVWAQLVQKDIVNNISRKEFASLKDQGPFVDGTFAGINPAGHVQVARIIIGRAGPNMAHSAAQEQSVHDTMRYTEIGGHGREFAEMFLASSKRAKAEKEITLKESKTWMPEDVDARKAIRLAELIIKYAAKPEYVHGPVDAVEIDRGSTPRWIQRKNNCPTN